MTSVTIPPQTEPTTVEKMRGLRWSIAGDSANTVFVQFTYFGSVFILFLDALGLSKSQIGLLLSFLPFAGLIALVIAPMVARFGYKRTFLTFWGTRTGFTALLLLTPWVVGAFGKETAVIFIGTIVALFALCRAAGETGKYPWTQEYVPNHVRGKFSALDNLFTTIIGIVAVAIAGFVIDRADTNQAGFLLLLGVGVLFGAISVWAYALIPGGAPITDPAAKNQRDLGEAINDRSFRNYLFGIALMTLATVPMTSFLPLFMQEEVGLRDSQVILLQNGTLIGGLVFVYVWGWAADRFGSMPIMLTGVIMRTFLPVFWLLMPKENAWSLPVALGIAFLQGAANMGWGIGSARLLFVRIVPPEKKTDYMALYYAWVGVVGGLSQLVGGWILDASQNISLQLPFIRLDPYSPLFLLGLALPLFSLFFFHGVQRDSNVSMGAFAGFLLRGNPFMAVESMIRYHTAKDEEAAVHMTERLGQAKSLLPMQELLESLADPRFNVRFEAIVAIGRTLPDEQLINALADVLHGSDPALSVMAAWALGRIRDPRARDTLIAAMDSNYRSIQAHSARSLGTLGDESVIPEMLQRLDKETDHGLQVAYASALGQLQAVTAVSPILYLLTNEQYETVRLELALALARLVGDEHGFVQLARQIQTDAGTALAQAITALTKKWQKESNIAIETSLLDESAEALSRDDLEQGFICLGQFLQQLPIDRLTTVQTTILQECAIHLTQPETSRPEYA
ncbi:MAG: MFS transporter, partial [Anaerolineales bacterium]|nr:MFS transporter [Anaerolineales bacterium]